MDLLTLGALQKHPPTEAVRSEGDHLLYDGEAA